MYRLAIILGFASWGAEPTSTGPGDRGRGAVGAKRTRGENHRAYTFRGNIAGLLEYYSYIWGGMPHGCRKIFQRGLDCA